MFCNGAILASMQRSAPEVFEAALALSEEERGAGRCRGAHAQSRASTMTRTLIVDVEHEKVHVVAVEALRKKPGYWRSRLRGG
jgi:hypothetical protein